MRKSLVLSVIILSLLLLVVGCGSSGRSYTVTFVLGDGRGAVTSEVSEGTALYVPEPPSEEYAFGGWFTDAELTRPYLKSSVGSDMTLYARFVRKGEYAVTLVYDNGDAATTMLIGGTLTEPASPHREGYVFTGWNDAATGEPYLFGRALTEAHTILVATWREVSEGVKLTLHYENGSPDSTISYAYSAIPEEPEAPQGNGEFLGWYADSALRVLFDFEAPLTKDTHIYAGWGIDAFGIGNRVVRELLTATVEIHTERKSLSLSAISTGSGVIYAEDASSYYILTNQHVVAKHIGYPSISYTVYDAYGNAYSAACLGMAAEYDLAVLRIAKGEKALSVAKFASAEAEVGSRLIAVGSPGGLNNAVTYGTLAKYDSANVSGSSVSFAVGWHDAYIANGSSGGAVFDTDLKIIGINYAASQDASGSFQVGVYIPLARIYEFLTYNNLPIPS